MRLDALLSYADALRESRSPSALSLRLIYLKRVVRGANGAHVDARGSPS